LVSGIGESGEEEREREKEKGEGETETGRCAERDLRWTRPGESSVGRRDNDERDGSYTLEACQYM
jgi:hypothetical protein